MKKAVIFDMDGTLWDSVDQIAASWNQAIGGLGIPDVVVTRERIIGIMGKTMDKFAEELFPDYSKEEGLRFLEVMELAENEYLAEHGALLLGDVEGTFRALKDLGYFIGIVSNSQAGYIEAFLSHYHLEGQVDDILSYGDTGMGKAENLKVLAGRGGLAPGDCVYVGDTEGDRDACAAAGMPFIWASYGFESVEGVPRIDALEELPERLQPRKGILEPAKQAEPEGM